MRSLYLVLSLLSFAVFAGPSLESVIPKMEKIVQQNSLGQMAYCSSFHCYHFSVDFCTRVGDSSCRVLEIGPTVLDRNGSGTGHGMNILRFRESSSDTFCLLNPQRKSNRLSSRLCWQYPVQDPIEEAQWGPPEAIIPNLCKLEPLACGPDKKTKFRITRSVDLESDYFKGWWENSVKSNGQVMRVCEMRNKVSKLDLLPSTVPLCKNIIGKHCSTGVAASVCKWQISQTSEFCSLSHCSEKGLRVESQWTNLPLPQCNQESKFSYCRSWLIQTKKISEAKIQNAYLTETTTHYCRNGDSRSSIEMFWCNPDGSIRKTPNPRYNKLGFSNEEI